MYSFSQARLDHWNVKSKVVEVFCGEDKAFKYHLVTLPLSVMGDLESHINAYSPVNGLLYQWNILSDKSADADVNPMLNTKFIFMLDNTECLEPYFGIEDLLTYGVGVLRRGSYDNLAEEFSQSIPGRVMFSLPPIMGGVPYRAGTLKKGHLAAVFSNTSAESIELDVYLRHTVNVHNL